MRSIPNEASTSRIPSLWEHVDSQFPDCQTSQTKPSFPKRKGARIGKPPPSLGLRPTSVPNPNLPYIDHMPLLMKPCIEKLWMLKVMIIVVFGL